MSATQTDIAKLINRVRDDGFVVFHDFLPKPLVAKARQEVAELFAQDLQERQAKGEVSPHYKGGAGHSILTSPTHLLLDLYGKSPSLDQLVEIILTNDVSRKVMSAVAGPHIKFRGYNCTRMTGEYNPPPSAGPAPAVHDWHRDSFCEIGLGIFLDPFDSPDSGTTSLIRGSHRFPYCPRWNCLFGPPYPRESILRFTVFNRLLARKVLKDATGAYGKPGDFYLFLNDTWHGRQANLHGNKGLRIMIGAFPADIPYPDRVPPLAPEVISKLPPALAKVVPHREEPPNPAATEIPETLNGTVLKDTVEARQEPLFPGLFFMARGERRLADRLISSK
ncbi:phytanoyl-CoA dioxygenase family protein [Kamptonema cortianum]|nr:phytanoyl-CoA dioxygenase family protein [Oscillatoria laete-virens]MDK3155374.1 phytanoyl-CoA dioxygenase family protein [Kamptonema cortianum]MDL5046123.1 phytanoyl-CoA dioxygenase family protein [Oscillatoria amoena NRMC-F 0135]MDL5052824.1 phytanoyl-CoA dioxygenase family protein [Oscillatoria laete-virens NRMC-F 0139]